MKKFAACLLGVLLYQAAFAQGYGNFNRFIAKADSAYHAKNYALSTEYYKLANDLSGFQTPEKLGTNYYNIACNYSLDKDRTNALLYLKKSFEASNKGRRRNPVSVGQIFTDGDLDFIRESVEFRDLCTKYYPAKAIALGRLKELSYGQLVDFIKILAEEKLDDDIIVFNKTVYWEKTDSIFILNKAELIPPDLKFLHDRYLSFVNCNFQINFIWNGEENNKPEFYRLNFYDCVFNGVVFFDQIKYTEPPKFYNSVFKGDLWLNSEIKPGPPEFDGLTFEACTLNSAWIKMSGSPQNLTFKNNIAGNSSDVRFSFTETSRARIHGNKFKTKNLELNFGDIIILRLTDNQFNNLLLLNTAINSEFDFENNNVEQKVLFDRTFFSDDPSSDVDWSTLDSLRIGFFKDYDANNGGDLIREQGLIDVRRVRTFKLLTGANQEAITEGQDFRELMGLYSMFVNLYKNKNDIESYNGCYIEIKELQSRRLRHLHETNKTFESYFRWKLSQLLKFYVRHGTDPARAIVISIYIILCFGVFFFFFPSDWDVTSKKNLVQNFRDFIQKNEKGYVKPFFILLGGFLLSLINAITLSLNAFITLGFGNIPTHGIARYVCVLEGFLGWFLLSIFTVALINQVL